MRILLCLLALAVPHVWAANQASLSLKNSQYVSNGTAYYRDGAGRDNSSISLFLNRELKYRKSLTAKTQVKDEFSSTENWNYLDVYQAYGTYRVNGWQLSAGRKMETWSSSEEEWKQGVFQSRYMQNKLRPQMAGLTGAFASSSYKSFLWTVGVLPVFVPDLGCHFWVDNNKFASKNPWFLPPASGYRFNDTVNDIHYSVDKPSAGEVIRHPGFAAKVEHSGSQFGSRLAGAVKPVPQLLYGFPSLNRVVVGTNGDYMDLVVTPRVTYHWIASADMWSKFGKWDVTGGLTHDHPFGDKLPAGSTSQTFDPAWIWSVIGTRPLEIENFAAMRLKLGFLKIEGGLGKDRGEFARPVSKFEGRFQYDEAYLAGLAIPVRGLFKNALETEARVVYDRIQNGGTMSLVAGYAFNRDWRTDFEMDFLGLSGTDSQNETGFLSTYRANDRVSLGMSYVF